MKRNSLTLAIVVAVTLTGPLETLAQSNAPVTRAQVKAELRQLEQVGYNPGRAEDADYPSDIQTAEARLTQKDEAARADSHDGDAGTTGNLLAHGAPQP